MLKKLNDLYEAKKLFLFNPCDCEAHPVLRPLGRALATFGSYCACCSGVRVIVAATLGAAFPVYTLVAVASFLVAFIAYEIIKGKP